MRCARALLARLLFACLLASPRLMAAGTAETLFAQGVSAFEAGNYPRALESFTAARDAGMNRPALHFNRGVTLYRLGRYAEAEAAFGEAARDPQWAALSRYNTGLAAEKRGDRAAAVGAFVQAWSTAEDEKVRALTFAMLERLGETAALPRTRTGVSLAVGHDSNVSLSSDSQVVRTARESDDFAEFSAGIQTPLADATVKGLKLGVQLYHLKYAHLDDFDLTDLGIGATWPTGRGDWRMEIGGKWDHLLLSGNDYQRVVALSVTGHRDRPEDRGIRLAYRLERIDDLDERFAFLAGWRHVLSAASGLRLGAGRLGYGYTLEVNRREDLRSGEEFFSYSPTRHALQVEGAWTLGAGWRIAPQASYELSRYADPNRDAAGAVDTREDRYVQVGFRLARKLGADWKLFADYSYSDNDSNFGEFSYVRNVVMVGVTRDFLLKAH
jgi:tetratricopeptide (TPR) repeat protein